MLRIQYDDEIVEFTLGRERYLTGSVDSADPTRVVWSMRIECREAKIRAVAPETESQREERDGCDGSPEDLVLKWRRVFQKMKSGVVRRRPPGPGRGRL